jgi:dihydrofolate reductase
MKRFRDITMGHPVIMGRKTYESLPDKFRPLPGRENIIITRDASYEAPGARVTHSLEEATDLAKTLDEEEIFIGGGQQTYEQALPQIDKLYLTIVESDKIGDTFFPPYEEEFTRETFREGRQHEMLRYTWVNLER